MVQWCEFFPLSFFISSLPGVNVEVIAASLLWESLFIHSYPDSSCRRYREEVGLTWK